MNTEEFKIFDKERNELSVAKHSNEISLITPNNVKNNNKELLTFYYILSCVNEHGQRGFRIPLAKLMNWIYKTDYKETYEIYRKENEIKVKEALSNMTGLNCMIENENKISFLPVFGLVELDKKSEYVSVYFNDALTGFEEWFYKLKSNYTKLALENLREMKSKYSLIFYEFLKSKWFAYTEQFMSYKDLRFLLLGYKVIKSGQKKDLGRYKLRADFNRYVLERIKQDMLLVCDYFEIREHRSLKKFVGYDFIWKLKPDIQGKIYDEKVKEIQDKLKGLHSKENEVLFVEDNENTNTWNDKRANLEKEFKVYMKLAENSHSHNLNKDISECKECQSLYDNFFYASDHIPYLAEKLICVCEKCIREITKYVKHREDNEYSLCDCFLCKRFNNFLKYKRDKKQIIYKNNKDLVWSNVHGFYEKESDEE